MPHPVFGRFGVFFNFKDHPNILGYHPNEINEPLTGNARVIPVVNPGSSTLTRMTGRRQKLPAVKPDTSGLNLWNLLCKNIGKDLSKISMPVTLNEPLSALQR